MDERAVFDSVLMQAIAERTVSASTSLPRLRAEGSDPEETLRAARDAFESLMPLADPMITGVQLASGWQHLAGSDETGCGPCLSCAASRSSRSSSWSIGS